TAVGMRYLSFSGTFLWLAYPTGFEFAGLEHCVARLLRVTQDGLEQSRQGCKPPLPRLVLYVPSPELPHSYWFPVQVDELSAGFLFPIPEFGVVNGSGTEINNQLRPRLG